MPLVTTRREGAACVLTLDRPDKLNALSPSWRKRCAASGTLLTVAIVGSFRPWPRCGVSAAQADRAVSRGVPAASRGRGAAG